MEELRTSLNKILLKKNEIEKKLDAEAEHIKEELKAILFGTTATLNGGNKTPQQIKKKTRLSDIADDESFDHRASITENKRKTSAESQKPASPAKSNASQESIPEGRPTRAAKLKAGESMKEPPRNSKLRRPTLDSGNSFRYDIRIKKEKEDASYEKSTKKNSNSSRKSSIESESNDPEVPQVVNTKTTTNGSVEPSKINDESLILIAKKTSVMSILSDDEPDADKMPPPTAPPKKKNVRNRKRSKEDNVAGDVVKQSLGSIISARTESTIMNDIEMTEISSASTILAIKIEKDVQDESATSKKGNKKKNKYRPIKVERLSEPMDTASPRRTRQNSKSRSIESVYEDAMGGDVPMNPVSSIPDTVVPEPRKNSLEQQPNATFISAASDRATSQDATFTANPAQETFIQESNPNATVTIVSNKNQDETFDVNLNGKKSDGNSLMTEDESFEMPLAQLKKPVVKAKPKHIELFNPCVQSPVKKKVEAFEKAAAYASSSGGSPPQRQTRTKTRPKKTNENEPENNIVKELKMSSSSSTTPIIGKLGAPALGRFLTPTQSSNITPVIGGIVKKLPSSTSKLMTFPKSNVGSASKTSSASSSRENSTEDLRRGYTKLQQLAEERRKKRELKQQQAAMSRETKEKERAERLKKLMDEREDKQRKKALEAEQKKRELEEINKNLKLQEEKRDAQKRLEKQQKEREMAEFARRERDHLEQMKILKIKQEMKMKMQEQKRLLALKKQKQNAFNFDMLHSDDSTDEEGKQETKKRPPLPEWSTSKYRVPLITAQAAVSTKIIDPFFSVQPMTPDLKEIFPAIDPKHLKRNSSVFWRTPPRYSEMPKY